MDEQSPPIINGPELHRKLEALQSREVMRFKPMRTELQRRLAIAADGQMYMRDPGKGNVRVAIDEQGRPHRMAKWDKARRKAEKRARVKARR